MNQVLVMIIHLEPSFGHGNPPKFSSTKSLVYLIMLNEFENECENCNKSFACKILSKYCSNVQWKMTFDLKSKISPWNDNSWPFYLLI